MRPSILTADVVKLAAMECAASCIATCLNTMGLDYRYFMLTYWNLTYYGNLLMLKGYIAQMDLRFAYGIEPRFTNGSEIDLAALLHEGHRVILLCHASRLRFFPERMLGLESHFFQHHIVLYGYHPARKQFLVVDPTADYVGEMSLKELYESSIRKGEFLYYTLELPKAFSKPSRLELFKHAAEFNYKQNVTHTLRDHHAFDLFEMDLVKNAALTTEVRNAWISQNNITISSIVKSRPLVWRSFCSLQVLTSQQLRMGEAYIDDIVKLWTMINYLLIRLKRNKPDAAYLNPIREKLRQVQTAENQLLAFIYEKGRERSGL